MDFHSARIKLIDGLALRGYLKSDIVIDAMKSVAREEFIPEKRWQSAYDDAPLPIGEGQTISAPHMVALMTEALELKPDFRVLEVGSGSGYQAAVLARVVSEGFVYSVERVPSLRVWASQRLNAGGFVNVEVFEGDGTMGLALHAPYDRVIVTAAAPRVPAALTDQLVEGGLLLVPVGGQGYQELLRVRKESDGLLSEENLGGCVFVPLIGEDGW